MVQRKRKMVETTGEMKMFAIDTAITKVEAKLNQKTNFAKSIKLGYKVAGFAIFASLIYFNQIWVYQNLLNLIATYFFCLFAIYSLKDDFIAACLWNLHNMIRIREEGLQW